MFAPIPDRVGKTKSRIVATSRILGNIKNLPPPSGAVSDKPATATLRNWAWLAGNCQWGVIGTGYRDPKSYRPPRIAGQIRWSMAFQEIMVQRLIT
jgi:hypothetical protein